MRSTAVNSTNFTLTSARDETIEGFYARDSTKMEFLPTNLGDVFPSLIGLSAQNCSIKEISKEYLKGLSELRWLWLKMNQIQKIDDDTFEHNPAVEGINLGEFDFIYC